MQKPVLFLKAHVDSFTRKDGVVVQAHETKVTAASHDDAQPKYALQGVPSEHLSNAVKGKDDLNKRAKVELANRGMDSDHKWLGFDKAAEHHGVESQGGAPDEVGSHFQKMHPKVLSAAAKGEIDLNAHARQELANRGHNSDGKWVGFDAAEKHHADAVKPAPKPRAKKAPPADVHHSELQEGDGITDASGNNHYVSHVTRGLGRHVVHTESGYSYHTDSAGKLTGFKRNGKSSIHPDGKAKPLPKAPAKKTSPAKPKNDPHPDVIGNASNVKEHGFEFNGKQYNHTGKEGRSMHDSGAVREAESADGHRVWADKTNRVHADSREDAKKFRGD